MGGAEGWGAWSLLFSGLVGNTGETQVVVVALLGGGGGRRR